MADVTLPHAQVEALLMAVQSLVANHALGIATYVNCPAEGEYERGHRDAMTTLVEESFGPLIKAHDELRATLAAGSTP